MAFNRENFVIYDEEWHTGATEVIQQAAIELNQAAGGSMAMTTQRMRGEFLKESFFKEIQGLVRDRDPNDLTDSTADDLEMGEEVAAKIHKSIHVEKALNAFNALGDDAREFSFIVGTQQGQVMVVDYLNTALASVVAAIRSEEKVVYDATETDKPQPSPANLNRIKKRMGDQSQRIVAWAMDATMLHDLVEENIESKITNVADVNIWNAGNPGLVGLPAIVTDSPFLMEEGGEEEPDKHFIVGLTERAVEAIEAEERNVLAETVGGKKNLLGRIQSEFAVINKVKGCAYTGGEHPTTSDLADPENWEFVVTSHKSGPGAIGVFYAIDETPEEGGEE